MTDDEPKRSYEGMVGYIVCWGVWITPGYAHTCYLPKGHDGLCVCSCGARRDTGKPTVH